MKRPVGKAAAILFLMVAAASPLRAQGEDKLPKGSGWKDSFYPAFTSLSNDSPIFVIHFEERNALTFYDRSPYSGQVAVDVGANTAGTRMAMIAFRAPLLWKDLRVAASLGATRQVRFGYFGLGNNTTFDDNLVTKSQPFYYRARRSRYLATAEVSRRIHGPLWVAGALAAEHSNLSDLPRPSLFRTDQGTSDVSDTDVRGRLTLVLDTRDNEFNTGRGVFTEASVTRGSGGDGYTRFTGIARGYLPIRAGTMVAARLAATGLTGTPALNTRFEIPTWESELPVYGGPASNRALNFQRFAGQDVLFGNLEIRHDLLNLNYFGAFTLLAYVDAGRVFEQSPLKLTTQDLQVGYGGGLAIRLLSFTIWTFNFSGGPDGFQFYVGNGWAF
jgi:surface antigen Omp85-like protein